jgi:hypothetical protein
VNEAIIDGRHFHGISVAVSIWDTAEHSQGIENLTAIREKLEKLPSRMAAVVLFSLKISSMSR